MMNDGAEVTSWVKVDRSDPRLFCCCVCMCVCDLLASLRVKYWLGTCVQRVSIMVFDDWALQNLNIDKSTKQCKTDGVGRNKALSVTMT